MQDGDSRDQNEVAVSALIERGLDEINHPASSDQVNRLTQLVSLLSEWAPRINLTGHRDSLEMASRLVLDAAALVHCLPELDSASTLTDLGTGAGFPGLPISILCPHLEVYLVDSRRKRHHFQREVRRRLALHQVEPILGRAEEVEIQASDVVIAQAMTRAEAAIDLMLTWARPGGLVVLPASEAAARPTASPGIETLELREYRVPVALTHRKLWVARVPLPALPAPSES